MNTHGPHLSLRVRVGDAVRVPADRGPEVYIASPLNPPLSLYGGGLVVTPIGWQGHDHAPVSRSLIINNPPFQTVICIISFHPADGT